MEILIKKLRAGAIIPAYQTSGSAAMDVAACVDEPVMLGAMERTIIPTGFALALPDGYEAQMRARSGLSAKYGVCLANGIGTIDADYRGEVGVILINFGPEPFTVEPGMRIAQMAIVRCEQAQLKEVTELNETERERAVMAAPDIKAVIFDCFGVLYLDNKTSLLNVVEPEVAPELHDVFTRNNYGYTSRAEYLSAVSDLTHLSVKEVEEYVASEHVLNKELIDVITHKLKGKYQVGLLSNIGRDWIDDFFTKHELHTLFDQVVLSGEEGLAKPHPAIFSLMASRLGLQTSQCIMIDDIEANCEGAEMAGMYSIHYTSNAQLFDALSDASVQF